MAGRVPTMRVIPATSPATRRNRCPVAGVGVTIATRDRVIRVYPVATGTSLMLNIAWPVHIGRASRAAAVTTAHRHEPSRILVVAAAAAVPARPITTTPR